MMVGLELREGDVLAVAMSDDGQVTARASFETKGSDAAAAAIAAVERVTPASSGPSSLGIAASAPDASTPARVLDALSSRYSALFQQRAVLGPGSAAAVAEAWIGAAPGSRDVVYFGVGEHATAGF